MQKQVVLPQEARYCTIVWKMNCILMSKVENKYYEHFNFTS